MRQKGPFNEVSWPGARSLGLAWIIIALVTGGCEGKFYAGDAGLDGGDGEGADLPGDSTDPDGPGDEGATDDPGEADPPPDADGMDPPPDGDVIDAPPDPDIVDIEVDNDLCGGTTLADRLRVTTVDVAPSSVGGGAYQEAVVLSPLADGSSRVAWNDGAGAARVTPLTAADTRAGADQVLENADMSGFVALPDGNAILGVRGDAMVLWKLDTSGAVAFETPFVGNNSHTSDGDKWIDGWSDCGRLAWSGSRFAVYFGHTQNWGADGNHQGDLYTYVDPAGTDLGGGWSWGCSHSLEVRLAWNGADFGPVCLSDCYPTKGIHINGYWGSEISAEPSGNCSGGSAASLGGLAPVSDGFYLTFTSPEGRSSADVVLVHVTAGGTVGSKIYLTDTAGVEETGAKLAAYGGNLLAAWMAGSSATFAVVDGSGAILEGPETLGVAFDPHDDFINFADGAVGWAMGSGSQLSIARLGLCP